MDFLAVLMSTLVNYSGTLLGYFGFPEFWIRLNWLWHVSFNGFWWVTVAKFELLISFLACYYLLMVYMFRSL